MRTADRPVAATPERDRSGLLTGGALVAATVFWGATFLVVKEAVAHVPPFEFLALRFGIATLVLGALWRRSVRGPLPWRALLVVGTALACGYAFQTLGLVYTGATNAAFITGLYVVFTPTIGALLYRRLPAASAAAGALLATTGLVLLSLRLVAGRPTFSLGDLLVLVCAFGFTGHILALGHFAPRTDVRTLAVGQLAVATLLFAALVPVEDAVVPRGAEVWSAIAFTALGATAFGFAVQTWAQRRLSPTRTAVILTMEPVFAAVFGFTVAGERLSARGWAGAALILAGMLAVEARPGRRRETV